MVIYGYGEDALTARMLQDGVPDILNQLGDTSSEHVAFFRPSFGRGGRSSANFGEFDAIIGTAIFSHLIEVKWSPSGEIRNDVVTLRPEQARRHQVLKEYISEWQHSPPNDWPSFARRMKSRLAKYNRTPPNAHRGLAQSLEFILKKLEKCGPPQDVLVYCCTTPDRLGQLSCPGFKIATYQCEPTDPGGRFIDLGR